MFQFRVKQSIQHCKYENQYRGEPTHYWLNARIVFQACDNVGKKQYQGEPTHLLENQYQHRNHMLPRLSN